MVEGSNPSIGQMLNIAQQDRAQVIFYLSQFPNIKRINMKYKIGDIVLCHKDNYWKKFVITGFNPETRVYYIKEIPDTNKEDNMMDCNTTIGWANECLNNRISESYTSNTTATATYATNITGNIANEYAYHIFDAVSATATTTNGQMKIPPKNKKSNFDFTIVDYKIINNTVVIVTFSDGTTEKAVCDENDTFDFEKAIEICVCKKKFGGSKEYNNAIKKALKQVDTIDNEKKREAEEQERIAHRKAKYAERQAKRKAKRRQEQVNIQSEAFFKAMVMYDEYAMDNIMDDTKNDVEPAKDE